MTTSGVMVPGVNAVQSVEEVREYGQEKIIFLYFIACHMGKYSLPPVS